MQSPASMPEINLHGTETVLVVDDEPAITSLTEVVLLEHGYKVFVAHDGLQALNILEKEGENIDVLISDIIMPDMDGCQLTKEVQQRYPHIKIQMVSGFADDRHHGLTDDELHKNMMYKPCSSRALLVRIRHLLDDNRVREKQVAQTILIMDDDYDIIELFQIKLESLGYNTVVARSGEEALELYRVSLQGGDRIAAMIVDLTVPGGMGGKELAPEILALDANARIIVSSGHTGSPEMINYKDFGFSGALEKTFNTEKITCLTLLALSLALVALYMYFVSASVVHVVIRKETNQAAVALNSEISQLENQFIDAQHRVSGEIASLQGYTDVTDKIFIDRTPSTLVLSTVQP
jgi:DNA-binding NtrC family response regulator